MTDAQRQRPPTISSEEFAERRRKLLDAARARGLDGLIVWSRGGAGADCYGDVYYLSNFHSPIPPLTNSAKWSAKGHAALVMPLDGPPVLLADTLDDPEERIQVEDARAVAHLPQAVADVVHECGLNGKKLGLVGQNSLLARDLDALRSAAWRLDLEPVDDIMDRLRYVKSDAELGLLRHAATIGCAWMNATMGAVQAGRTEAEIVAEGLPVLIANGGRPYDVAISSGPNSQHFFGSLEVPHWNAWRPLEKGDLVHADLWGPVQGYLTDFVRSTVVGGTPTPEQRELLEGAVALIDHIIAGVQLGVTFDDLYHRGAGWLRDNGFGEDPADGTDSGHAFAEIFPSFGHSMGLVVEPPYLVEGEMTTIQPNVAIAIEGVVGRSGVGATGFERNIIVTEAGVEILDAGSPTTWWD